MCRAKGIMQKKKKSVFFLCQPVIKQNKINEPGEKENVLCFCGFLIAFA